MGRYRYFVGLKARMTKEGELIPKTILFAEREVVIPSILKKDHGYSGQGEFCERFYFKSRSKIQILYHNNWDRWYIELPLFRPDLMDPFDRAHYLPEGDSSSSRL